MKVTGVCFLGLFLSTEALFISNRELRRFFNLHSVEKGLFRQPGRPRHPENIRDQIYPDEEEQSVAYYEDRNDFGYKNARGYSRSGKQAKPGEYHLKKGVKHQGCRQSHHEEPLEDYEEHLEQRNDRNQHKSKQSLKKHNYNYEKETVQNVKEKNEQNIRLDKEKTLYLNPEVNLKKDYISGVLVHIPKERLAEIRAETLTENLNSFDLINNYFPHKDGLDTDLFQSHEQSYEGF